MIEEQLISFQVAKLAKEKGCTLNTPKAYNDNGVLVIQSNYPSYIDELDISAPTPQSLLQKWLREVHGIYINAHSSNIDNKLFKTTFVVEVVHLHKLKFYSGAEQNKDYFETYEEALEVGLFSALNLIKI